MLKLLLNPQRLKVMRFFVDNPNSIDTPRGVSAWTNLSLAETRRTLEELSKKGLLRAYRTSSTVGYSLTENKKALRAILDAIHKAS